MLPAPADGSYASGHVPTAVLPVSQVGAALAPASAPAATGSGRRALVRIALGALAVLVVLAVLIGILQHGSGTAGQASGRTGTATTSGAATSSTPAPSTAPTTAAPRTTAPSAPPKVHVTASAYIRHPVAQVRAALVALGLHVTLTPVTTRALPPGLVTAVAPAGDLPPGSSVRVSYAVAPSVAPAPEPKHRKHGKGGG